MHIQSRHVPKGEPGADWRDLPNLGIDLSVECPYFDPRNPQHLKMQSNIRNKLAYTHDDVRAGRAADGSMRGVCPCADGVSKCLPGKKNPWNQGETLIPWCLPHTSARHNQWKGLYGRIPMDGFFSTTVTAPEPMGKQGCVIHPSADRIFSVREGARSQTFPDYHQFYGDIGRKYMQIGNAVPPLLHGS